MSFSQRSRPGSLTQLWDSVPLLPQPRRGRRRVSTPVPAVGVRPGPRHLRSSSGGPAGSPKEERTLSTLIDNALTCSDTRRADGCAGGAHLPEAAIRTSRDAYALGLVNGSRGLGQSRTGEQRGRDERLVSTPGEN